MVRRGALEIETSASTPVPSRSAATRARQSPTTRRRVLGHGLIDRFKGHRRHASAASSQASVVDSSPPTSVDDRRVLAPLHFNLRRLPSRRGLSEREKMRAGSSSGSSTATAGTKRKRAASGSENATRGRSRSRGSKRRRGSSGEAIESDAESESVMDVDDGDEVASADEEDSTQEYLLYQATDRHLIRLRKDDLIELYNAAGIDDSPEDLTKQGLVDAIIAARDDGEEEEASLPPSSPRDRDGASSVYSSDNDEEDDDGNVAAGEETDLNQLTSPRIAGTALRRRVTYHNVSLAKSRPEPKGRTMSMGLLEPPSPTPYRKAARQVESPTVFPRTRKRTTSLRSSPTVSIASTSRTSASGSSSLPSPPATRMLRNRKISGNTVVSSGSSRSRKGKGKQVDFDEHVVVTPVEPIEPDLSELSELTESDADTVGKTNANPSPRRLRSRPRLRGEGSGSFSKPSLDAEMAADSDENAEDDDEEVDQLVDTSADSTPQPRRTPLKRRLRPRKMQTYTPPSDGDGDDERDAPGAEEGDDEEGGDTEEELEEDEVDEPTPRKLRSGRVVQPEVVQEEMEEDELSEMSVDEEVVEGTEDVDVEVASAEEDEEEAEAEEEEGEGVEYESSGEDVDWSTATKTSLQRLRRDELVRLSETRGLDTSGTKPQLADALIKWARARTVAQPSAPSSTATVTGAPVTVRPAPATARPGPATARPGGRRSRKRSGGSNKTATPPVLLRDEHVHLDEPRTPPLSGAAAPKDEDLELDLAGLGLEDREIPCEHLTKLEKIGSGGFKDVFIGKWKGRKVAIAEFRGTLSSMDVKELKLLGGFNHKNIVRFLGVSIPPEESRNTPVMIVSELCENGDLFDYIRNVPAPPIKTVLKIALDIARGLEYLHTRQPSVIHRDCKSSNILITARGSAKIADFGLAKVKQTARSMVRSLVGTVNWQAPELWHPSPKYNHKVDVFAAGVVFWEMLQWHVKEKKYPWEGMNEHAIYDAVGAKKQRPSVHGLRRLWCSEIVDLIERMWAHDANDRPDMSEVVHELERLYKLYK